jgi:hypothetical protein
MDDKLNMAAINSLPHPLIAKFGSTKWPVYDIDVSTGLMRIDVCGMLDHKHFCEASELIDGCGDSHDPEMFWTDYEATP